MWSSSGADSPDLSLPAYSRSKAMRSYSSSAARTRASRSGNRRPRSRICRWSDSGSVTEWQTVTTSPRTGDGSRISPRLVVAASPQDSLSDTHWLRADVDHHFVRQAIAAGVDYRDQVELTNADVAPDSVRVSGTRNGVPFELRANFLIDASGPSGFLARQLSIPSALEKTETRSALVFSHFDGVRLMKDVVPGMPQRPYPDDWAAVHHIIDEGWMYSLRFDDGVTSAGFLLTPSGISSLRSSGIGDAATKSAATSDAATLWRAMVQRYPTLASAFA